MSEEEVLAIIRHARKKKDWPIRGGSAVGYTLHLNENLALDRDRNSWLQGWFVRIYDSEGPE